MQCLPRVAFAAIAAILAALLSILWWLQHDGAPPLSMSPSPELVRLHRSWLQAVRQFVGGSMTSGNIVPEQAWAYLDMARRNATVICETGFFRGVSAHLWLYAHAENRVYSFDVGFPHHALDALSQSFGPGRLRTYAGSTRRTLPRFQLPPGEHCDVVSIDASHDGWDPYYDLAALLPHTRCGAHVIFDDTFEDRATNKTLDNDPRHASFYNACTRSYWQLVHEGKLRHLECTRLGRRLRWGRYPKGYCIAQPGEAVCPKQNHKHGAGAGGAGKPVVRTRLQQRLRAMKRNGSGHARMGRPLHAT